MVTFLLTDVVGSTRLWEASPRGMAAAIARHDELMGAATTAAGGTLLKSRGEGDATFSVFERATDAARAALDAQRRLAAEPWPQGVELRVRMALHVGEAVERDHDYYGPAVNRVARLRSVADGCEILVSDAVAQVLLDGGDGWVLERVGERSLKDLSRPEIVYRLLGALHEPPAEAATTAGGPAGRRVDIVLPLPSTLPVTDLVGRAAAVRDLVTAWVEVEHGERRTVLVAGEPGIGKSALAARIAADVHARGGLVLHGRCDEGLRVAYQPIAEAVRPLLDALSVTDLGTMSGAGELARLVPDLAARLPDLQPPLRADADAERWALFQAVGNLFTLATSARPALLVIDDLHWAAGPTLQLLRHLVRSSVSRLLIIATYRHTDVDRADDLADLLADLRRESGVQRVVLRGLDGDGMRDLVEAVGGEPLGADAVALADRLHVETAGNPFFAVEVLRHLVETGSIYRTQDGRWASDVTIDDIGLPESVREVVGRRLSRLSDRAQRALRVAAVVGPTFSLRLLEAIPDAADRPDDLLDAMDEAVGAALLVEERGLYDFAHALIRQTLLDELTSTRRIRLHRRIGEAIEALDERDAHLDALAQHFAEAAFDGQAAKAADYALAAARQAQERAAPEQATALLRRGIEALDTEAEVDLARRAELGLALGVAAYATPGTSREGVISALDAAIDDARRARAAHQLLEGVALRLLNSEVSHRDAANGELIEEAAGLLDRADARGRAMLATTRALWIAQSPDGLLKTSEQALQEARDVGDPDVLVVAMNALVRSLYAEPLPDRLLAVGEELLQLASHNATRRSNAHAAVATALLTAGRMEEFHRLAVDIRDLARATRSWHATYYMLTYEGSVALLEGRWADAERTSAALLEHGGEDADAFNVWTAWQGILHRERGTLDVFRPAVELAVEQSPRIVAFRGAIVLAHADAGRADTAGEQLAIAMSRLPDVARDQLWPITVAVLADAASAVGDTPACAELEPLLTAWSGLLIASAGGTFCWASAEQLLGQLALTLGRTDDAVERFRAAHALAERIGSPPFAARAQLWLGRALVDLDLDAAKEALRAAIAIGSALGMSGIVRDAERLLAGHPGAASIPG